MQLASFQKTFKTIGISLFLLVVLGGTILLGKEASRYFASASTCQVKDIGVTSVTANSVSIIWSSDEATQGTIEYGTNAGDLTFSAPEAQSSKNHNVSLSLLTPNTIYYYLVKIGDKKCDSSGQSCNVSCVPWSFTTAPLTFPTEIVQPLVSPTMYISATSVPTVVATATIVSTPTVVPTSGPTSSVSLFCQQTQANIGVTSSDSVKWQGAKQYDIDNNGVINSIDVIKCKQAGK